jgi:putative heme iron utilization protein
VQTPNRSGDVAAAARQARWLADSAEFGWLTSYAPGPAAVGSPVEVSTDRDGAPLFLVSADSPHNRTLLTTRAASLLLAEPAMGGLLPQDAARLTLLGRAQPLSSPATMTTRRFARDAEAVCDTALELFRLEVSGARYQPRTRTPELTLTTAWRRARPGRLPEGLATLVDHLNSEHGDALLALNAGEGGPPDAHGVVIRGLRPQRLELAALTASGVTRVQLTFPRPVATPADLAAALLRRLGRVAWGHCTRTLPRGGSSAVPTR